VNRVCFFRFVCVVEFLAALAVRVIDAFNAETLYGGGLHGFAYFISPLLLTRTTYRSSSFRFCFGYFQIRWMASISE
jgi:hypothetical protein